MASGSPAIGATQAGYFGQKFTTNDLTVSWDATSRTTLSFTYRYQDHLISEGQGTGAHNVPIPANNTTSGEVTIHENGGIFTAALRPAKNWDLNGSVEAMYNDNAFTPMGFRQLRHYRAHTIYRPKSWATVSGAFNDLERHNNTNNNQNFTGNTTAYFGPLDHADHSRVVSFGTELFPNDRYGLDFNYSYNDVYMADNICFQGAPMLMPGSTVAPAGNREWSALRPGRSRSWIEYGAVRAGQRFRRRSDAVCLSSVHVAQEEGSLQSGLSRQLGERQPVLYRCRRRQRLAGIEVSNAVPELLMGVQAGADLEG